MNIPSPRRALLVAEAAGDTDAASAALGRTGFSAVVTVARFELGLAKLRAEPFDLLVVPVGDLASMQLEVLERELRGRPALKVIGTAPTASPDLILSAMRAGIHEFLVSPPAPNDLASAAEKLTRRTGSAQSGRVIAVYSAKGGLGTTSVAINVACAFAAGAPANTVALTDCVFTGGDIHVALNLRPSYDVRDLVAKLDEADGDLVRSLMTPAANGINVLPVTDDPVMDDILGGSTIVSVIERLRDTFPVTVVDCEHHLCERTLAVLDAADTILVVTQPSVSAIRSTTRTLDLFGRLGYDATKVRVLLNRFGSDDVFTIRNVTDAIKRDVFASLPNDYAVASAAQNKGIAVISEAPESKLAKGFDQLVAKLGKPGGSPGTNTVQSSSGVSRTTPSRLSKFFGKNR